MDVKTIVTRRLVDEGFEGLYNSDMDSSCTLDSLMFGYLECDCGRIANCRPGFKQVNEYNETIITARSNND